MALKGKSLVVSVATTSGGSYASIAERSSASMNHSGSNIDVSTMGTDFISRIQGLKDGTYSVSGFFATGDTNGQVRVRTAWLNDSGLFVRFLPDGTTGFQQEVKVASYSVNASVDGAVEFSAELEGTGAITTV
jgi:predicted secreted protein